MVCESCGKKVPSGAKSCMHCESRIDADLPEMDPAAAMQALAMMDEDMLKQLKTLAQDADSADDFVNAIFLGNCPKCGSSNVGNCEETRGIEDVTVGRCFHCGLLWCSECGYQMKKGETGCPHWSVCEACPDEEECPFIGDTTQCPSIAEWMESMGIALPLRTDDDDDVADDSE